MTLRRFACLGLVLALGGLLLGACAATPPAAIGSHHGHHLYFAKNPKGYTTETVPNIAPSTTLPPETTQGATPVAAPAAPSPACTANLEPSDHLPIQVADAPAGSVFCLASGTYQLLQTVVPKSGDTFIGNPSNRPLIDASQTTVGFDGHTTSGVTYENLMIEGAKLDGSKVQCSYCGRGIWGGNALRVFNLYFTGNQQAGIAGSSGTTTPWLIVGSQFVDNGNAAEVGFSSAGIKGSNAYTILNSYVANNVGSGIWCDVGCIGGTWTVEGNTVVNNTAGGIRYEISDAGAVIRDNLVKGNDISGRKGLAGIEIASSGNAIVENNIVDGNAYAAILVDGNGRHDSAVTNDVIEDNKIVGSAVRGCSRVGVTCENNT